MKIETYFRIQGRIWLTLPKLQHELANLKFLSKYNDSFAEAYKTLAETIRLIEEARSQLL
jgi:hypothetical protein